MLDASSQQRSYVLEDQDFVESTVLYLSLPPSFLLISVVGRTPQHEISVDPEREGGIAISMPTMPKADCLVAGHFMVYHSEKRSE